MQTNGGDLLAGEIIAELFRAYTDESVKKGEVSAREI